MAIKYLRSDQPGLPLFDAKYMVEHLDEVVIYYSRNGRMPCLFSSRNGDSTVYTLE